jgi:hypothetical protein
MTVGPAGISKTMSYALGAHLYSKISIFRYNYPQ